MKIIRNKRKTTKSYYFIMVPHGTSMVFYEIKNYNKLNINSCCDGSP